MGIVYLHLHLFAPQFRPGEPKGDRVLTLGNQDTYFSYEQADNFFRRNGWIPCEVPASERRLADSHGTIPNDQWNSYQNYVHQQTLFRMMGYDARQVKSVDANAYENADLIHDFNTPIPEEWKHQFDLVIDFGTTEHIFDVCQCFRNIVDLLDVGGRVLHFAPANLLNHGLFNFNVGLLKDVYAVNGFDMEEADYVASRTDAPAQYRVVPADAIGEVEGVPGHVLAARGVFRKRKQLPFTKPMQNMYRQLYAAWETQAREIVPQRREEKRRTRWSLVRKSARAALPGEVRAFELP